jgi:hypothetical protein
MGLPGESQAKVWNGVTEAKSPPYKENPAAGIARII